MSNPTLTSLQASVTTLQATVNALAAQGSRLELQLAEIGATLKNLKTLEELTLRAAINAGLPGA